MQPYIPDLTAKHSIYSQAMGAIDVIDLYFSRVIHGCLYNQAMADA